MTSGLNDSIGGLLSLDVKLVSWPGITLEVSDNFYAIFWIFLILALILMTFSVAISGILSVVLIVATVKNWSLVKTLVLGRCPGLEAHLKPVPPVLRRRERAATAARHFGELQSVLPRPGIIPHHLPHYCDDAHGLLVEAYIPGVSSSHWSLKCSLTPRWRGLLLRARCSR